MHILFATPAFPPAPGGAERYVWSLAHNLASQGLKVTVVSSAAGNEGDFWRPGDAAREGPIVEHDGPIKVYRCPLSGVLGGRRGLLAWRKAMVLLSALPGDHSARLSKMAGRVPPIAGLEAALASLDPEIDLYHAFNISWEYPIIAAWRQAQLSGKPLVITPFGHFGASTGSRVTRNSAMDHQRRALNAADWVFTLTDFERGQLVAAGVEPEKVQIVGSGLDLLPGAGDLSQANASSDAAGPVALFIGRASRDKGAIDAAEATLTLRREGRPIRLLLAGQQAPEFRRYYKRLAPAARAAVKPLGIVDEATKQALLRDATMLLLPSHVESFGIVILEAWSYGKPVVAARAGAIPGVIDEGENGLLVTYGKRGELAAAMGRLLDDPELAKSLGESGYKKLRQQYTWHQVSQSVLDGYRLALPGQQPVT